MAYNAGFPIGYQPSYQSYNYIQQPQLTQPVNPPQMTQMTQPVNDTGILWVQGEAGAKSWAVAPGKSVMLMDSESNTFYIKSSDNSGMPMPLRIFDYKERTAQTQQTPAIQHQEIDTSKFVTWEDLDKKLEELIKSKVEVNSNGKSTV